MAFRKLYKAISNGVRQNTSDFRSWSKAGDIIIALPPLSEQNIIADYIDARCQEIESMIAALRSEISLITEYRTRMISDVVTGKVDIRDIEVSSIAVKEINVESFEVEESDEITDVEVEEDADD
ncbi:hypothetical protein SDC9_189852 [bioreactor metagenome]|uniref:Type I restriction modification DNA specificity domain-containing protein n=1 Tax=bioreactor metagenome TaxID=1076179 RepID=A0A645HTA8_9ZZZZ